MKIFERLEYVRKKEKLSRTKFGIKLGNKSEDTIYNLERGRTTITNDIIEEVCKTFKINKEWLENGTGDIYDVSPESLQISDSLSKVIDSEELSELVSKLTKLSRDKIKVINALVDLMPENEK